MHLRRQGAPPAPPSRAHGVCRWRTGAAAAVRRARLPAAALLDDPPPAPPPTPLALVLPLALPFVWGCLPLAAAATAFSRSIFTLSSCDVRLCAAPYHALSHPPFRRVRRIMTVARALWVLLLLTFAMWLGAIVRFSSFCLRRRLQAGPAATPVQPS